MLPEIVFGPLTAAIARWVWTIDQIKGIRERCYERDPEEAIIPFILS